MFNRPTDLGYIKFLRRLHRSVLVDWYLEIGCRDGRSMQHVRGKTIGVDPFFQIELNVIGGKPAFMGFQQTSDDFFAGGTLSALGIELSFSFLDGMHLMEFLLRDFMNAEACSADGGVIAMHDCCPSNIEMTSRDVENLAPRAWTGDVWKLLPILKKYRPDLSITVLGCKPTGLVLVHGIDPQNTVLKSNYDKIVDEWRDQTLEAYGSDRFYGGFDYTPVLEVEQADYPMFDKVRLAADLAAAPTYVSP